MYPFLEVAATPGLTHEVVTVLVARPAGSTSVPIPQVQPDADGWRISVGDLRAHIGTVDGGAAGTLPEVTWG